MAIWRLWVVLAAVTALVLTAFACGGGDDDDDDDNDVGADDDDSDDDDDDDSDDDDDTDDDDDAEVTVSNLSVGSCDASKAMAPDPSTDPYDMVELDWVDGVLTVHRPGAIVNCGVDSASSDDMRVDVSVSGSTIEVGETFTGSVADCICSVNMSYDIEGIPPGNYSFSHTGYGEELKSASAGIADFDVTLEDGHNYQWGVPLVDTITGLSTDPYAADTDINLIVSPCFLEDGDSVQVTHRAGWTDASADGVWFIVHDRRDLDDPGVKEDVCILFNYVIEGGLDAGSYTFFATSYDFREEYDWTLLARTNPVLVE